MYVIFLLLLLGYYGVNFILNQQGIRKLKNVEISEKIRVKFYWEWILQRLIPVLAVFGICVFANITIYDIGLRELGFYYNTWFTIVTFVISGLILISILNQKYRHRLRDETTPNIKNEFEENISYSTLLNLIIPRSIKEKHLFFYVTLKESFSGELVLRGFLYYILQGIFPQISIITILIISSVVFGFLISYGGFVDILENTFYNVLFGCLFLVTNSIFPGIMFHFFIMYFGYPSFPVNEQNS